MTQPADIPHTPYSLPDVTTWHDRFLQWLERLYTSPKLYQWSMSNPLTRWIPRRRTQKLFDLMSGFVYSQVLLGCVRLDLFKMLQRAPADLKQISHRVGVPEAVLQRLLLSAVSLGLLE
jgi:demethylspheroidene O-methyltransferase